MASNENRNVKADTIRFLKNMRNLWVVGFTFSALATLTLIVYGACVWLGRCDLFTGDWWGAVSWCFLAYFVLMLYAWMTIVAWDVSGAILDWIVGCLFVPSFIVGYLLFNTVLIMLNIWESNNAPVAFGLWAAATYIASMFSFGSLCETNTQIREKTDPNFKRACGFS